MMRLIPKLTTFLMLGAATTVVVAWSFALARPELGADATMLRTSSNVFDSPVLTSFILWCPPGGKCAPPVTGSVCYIGEPPTRAQLLAEHDERLSIMRRRVGHLAPIVDAALEVYDDPRSPAYFKSSMTGAVCVVAAGYPFRCLWFQAGMLQGQMPPGEPAICFDHANLNDNQFFPRALPLRPLLVGFVSNTLIYGIALFAGSTGFLRLRKFVRVRSGRCPICSYDLRATAAGDACPECGTSVTPAGDPQP